MLKPDVVVSVGDRFETMATAVAAAYMNIPLAHTMGGEISGTIDESIRHAVTKLSHLHFPANQQAADRIVRMGEDPPTVHVVGCPRIDLVAEIVADATGISNRRTGSSAKASARTSRSTQPFLLVSQHPVTTEYGHGEQQIVETLMALHELQMPTIMLWPNADAGSEDIARGMRKFRETLPTRVHPLLQELPDRDVRAADDQLRVRGRQFERRRLREGAFIGVPTVNIGTRQQGRDRADQRHRRRPTTGARSWRQSGTQLAHGRYPSRSSVRRWRRRRAHRDGARERAAAACRSVWRTDGTVLGVIPARGGSKGIPNKNLAPLCGRPLLAYTADAAQASTRLTRTIVSTDDPRIAECRAGRLASTCRSCALQRSRRTTRRCCPCVQHAIERDESSGFQHRHRRAAPADLAASPRRAHRRRDRLARSGYAAIRWCRSSKCRTSSTLCPS